MWGAFDAHGQDTRSLGMAGTSMALARGTDAPLWNPANLALPREHRWSLTVFDIAAAGSNDSFPKRYYDTYNGAYLDEAAKNDILGRITAHGLGIHADTHVRLFSVAYENYALTLLGRAAARAALPKDILDLALFGNQLNRDYSALGSDAHALSTASLCVSAAFPVTLPYFEVKASAVGGTLKYHFGISYAELLKADLSTTTTPELVEASGTADFRYGAPGGHGFSLDLACAADINERWYVGMTLSDIISVVHFDGDSYRGTYSFSVDSLSALSFDETDIDSIFFTEEREEERAHFSTTIPAELKLGGGYRFNKVHLTATYLQGFRRTGAVSSRPGVAMGAEYDPWPLLSLRTGIGFGGVHGFRLAWGLSFTPGPVRVDLAFQNIGGFTADQSRGISAGIGIRCEW